MKEKTLKDFVKVSTYAKQIGTSATWVYKLINKGKLDLLEVDVVKFVKPDEAYV